MQEARLEASRRREGYYLASGWLLGGVRAASRRYMVVVGYLRGGRRMGAGRYNIYNRKCQPPVITGAAAVACGFLSARRRGACYGARVWRRRGTMSQLHLA